MDNVSRPELVNMCQFMHLRPYGADAYLRFQLRSHMRSIRRDDARILYEVRRAGEESGCCCESTLENVRAGSRVAQSHRARGGETIRERQARHKLLGVDSAPP